MAEKIKISGKSLPLPQAKGSWKFEKRPGGWTIATSPEGKRERVAFFESRLQLSANVGGNAIRGEIQSVERGSGSNASLADLTAQFPGKVRKILVTVGAQVNEAEPLILLEAMKMEFAVKSPFTGKVEKILVKEGQQISPGDVLIDIKEAAK